METNKIKQNNEKQSGLWFECKGGTFFVESPFSIAMLDYITYGSFSKELAKHENQ